MTTVNNSKCQKNEGNYLCTHSHQVLSLLNIIRMSKMSEIVILSVCLLHNLFLLYKRQKKEDFISN